MNDIEHAGAGGLRLQQQIVRAAQRHQPQFDGGAPVLKAGGVTQALGGNRNDGRQRVLDAVMQFLEQQTLQLLGGFVFRGINASLSQETRRVYARLSQ
jgi:hypothetical protein